MYGDVDLAVPIGSSISDVGDINGDGVIDAFSSVSLWIDGATGGIHRPIHINPNPLQVGDSNRDYQVDEHDLILVGKNGKFEEPVSAGWSDGDWNGAPGGNSDAPPLGDGRFDDQDLTLLIESGLYLSGPYADSHPANNELDTMHRRFAATDTVVTYDTVDGSLSIATNGTPLTSLFLRTESDMFTGEKPPELDGMFDRYTNDSYFRFDLRGFAPGNLGVTLPTGLSWSELQGALRIDASVLGGGDLGNVRLDCRGCVVDINRFQSELRTANPSIDFDLNGDGSTDQSDFDFLITEFYGTHFGDSNLDGRFDSRDLVRVFVAGRYEDGVADNATWQQGDWDGNGDFESSDLVLALHKGGYDFGTPTPDPVFGELRFEEAGTIDDAVSFAADLDGDGDPDLVRIKRNGARWFETQREAFVKHDLPVDSRLITLIDTDLDADGDLDLLFRNQDSQIGWLENLNGEGDFSSVKVIDHIYGPWGLVDQTLTTADLNGDNLPEILVADDYSVFWYANKSGDFKVQPDIVQSSFAFYPPPGWTVSALDVDADGDMDLYASNFSSSAVWFENVDGTGNFVKRVSSSLLSGDTFPVDLDGDGDMDLITDRRPPRVA